MSTTISSLTRRVLRFVLAGGLVLTVWFALLALATLAFEPSQRVVVFASPVDAISALSRGDALILGGGSGYTIMHGRRQGFVRQLYAGGAWLVLPASAGGCRGFMQHPVRTASSGS